MVSVEPLVSDFRGEGVVLDPPGELGGVAGFSAFSAARVVVAADFGAEEDEFPAGGF